MSSNLSYNKPLTYKTRSYWVLLSNRDYYVSKRQYCALDEKFFKQSPSFQRVIGEMQNSPDLEDKFNLAAWYIKPFNNIGHYFTNHKKEAFGLYEEILKSSPNETQKKKAFEAIAYLCLTKPDLWNKEESLVYHYAKNYFDAKTEYNCGMKLLLEGLLPKENHESITMFRDGISPNKITHHLLENFKFQEAFDFNKAHLDSKHDKEQKGHVLTKMRQAKTSQELALKMLTGKNFVKSLTSINRYKENLKLTHSYLDSTKTEDNEEIKEILTDFISETGKLITNFVITDKGERKKIFIENLKQLISTTKGKLSDTKIEPEPTLLQAFSSLLVSVLSFGVANYATGRSAFCLFSSKYVLQKEFNHLDSCVKTLPIAQAVLLTDASAPPYQDEDGKTNVKQSKA